MSPSHKDRRAYKNREFDLPPFANLSPSLAPSNEIPSTPGRSHIQPPSYLGSAPSSPARPSPPTADFIEPSESTPLLRSGRIRGSSFTSVSFASGSSTPASSQIDLSEEEGSEGSIVTRIESPPAAPITPTPLPMRQLTTLLVGQLAEPVVATVLFPFINQLVSEVGITGGDDKKVGYYAGFIESLFFFAEFCMVLRWGRLSDRIGRKPVILCGLMGLTLSSACFGLSKSYWGLIISRAMAGALSGNIGVMKSAIGEITDSTNIAEGFAMLPVVWSIGATVGPLIGGFFSRPQDKFPRVFAGEFWKEYPYFLPCVCASFVCMMCFATVAIFFEESLPGLKRSKRMHDDKEYQSLDFESDSPVSPRPKPSRLGHQRSSSEETLVNPTPKTPSIREILTPPVTVAVANYGVIALLDIAFCALLPLFYSTPVDAGGLGLQPAKIGTILGALGLMNGVIQGMYSAKAQRVFGVKNVYVVGILSFVAAFATFPIMNSLARRDSSLLYLVLVLQLSLNVLSNMSFGCIFLFITAAAEKNSLGATNGIAQTMASLMRMIGPASTTSLFAMTMSKGLMGGTLVYWVLVAFTFIGLVVSIPLPKTVLISCSQH